MVERAKILLVDDRPENLVALEAVLGALDQTLVRATSGEEALKALLTEDFAVILLDVQMPGLDGFETAAHIKRRERTKDIPIIFLTAVSNGPHHTFRGYAAGAVDYLAKPFDPWILRAKVSVFVELHRKNLLLKEQAQLLADRLAERDEAGRDGACWSPSSRPGSRRSRRTCTASSGWPSRGSCRTRRSRARSPRPSSAPSSRRSTPGSADCAPRSTR